MKNKNAAIFAETIDEGENTTAHIKITGDRENLSRFDNQPALFS